VTGLSSSRLTSRITRDPPWLRAAVVIHKRTYDQRVNSGQAAFYASIATAIPVVLVVYVAGARGLAKEGLQRYFDLLETKASVESPPRWRVAYKSADLTTLRGRLRFAALMSIGVVVVSALESVFGVLRLAAIALIVLVVASPVVGEYFALHALSTNHSTTTATAWASIGIAGTGVALLGPFLLVSAPDLVFAVINAIMGFVWAPVLTWQWIIQPLRTGRRPGPPRPLWHSLETRDNFVGLARTRRARRRIG
jgi:hypothetical protein